MFLTLSQNSVLLYRSSHFFRIFWGKKLKIFTVFESVGRWGLLIHNFLTDFRVWKYRAAISSKKSNIFILLYSWNCCDYLVFSCIITWYSTTYLNNQCLTVNLMEYKVHHLCKNLSWYLLKTDSIPHTDCKMS